MERHLLRRRRASSRHCRAAAARCRRARRHRSLPSAGDDPCRSFRASLPWRHRSRFGLRAGRAAADCRGMGRLVRPVDRARRRCADTTSRQRIRRYAAPGRCQPRSRPFDAAAAGASLAYRDLGLRPAGRRCRRRSGVAFQAAAPGHDRRRSERRAAGRNGDAGTDTTTGFAADARTRTHTHTHTDTGHATCTCARARCAQASLDRSGRPRRAAGPRRAGARRRSSSGCACDGGRGTHCRRAGRAAGPAERRAAHQ